MLSENNLIVCFSHYFIFYLRSNTEIFEIINVSDREQLIAYQCVAENVQSNTHSDRDTCKVINNM